MAVLVVPMMRSSILGDRIFFCHSVTVLERVATQRFIFAASFVVFLRHVLKHIPTNRLLSILRLFCAVW